MLEPSQSESSEPLQESQQPENALRRARRKRGLRQKDAAEQIGCSLAALQSWENGRRNQPQQYWWPKICEVYQCTPEEVELTRPLPRKARKRSTPKVSPPPVSDVAPEHNDVAEEARVREFAPKERATPVSDPSLAQEHGAGIVSDPGHMPEENRDPTSVTALEQEDTPEEEGAPERTPEEMVSSPERSLVQRRRSFLFSKGERSRRTLLARMKKNWIDGELRNVLRYGDLITLELRECPQALASPRFRVDQDEAGVASLLPTGISLAQMYHRTGDLLLLGDRGAGKTTLLLGLLHALLRYAEQDEDAPMPVVFPLASWSGKHASLEEWLIEVLNEDYFMAKRVAQTWVKTDRLVVLLDGLDKVPEALRHACVQAINRYQNAHPEVPLVVCSQTEAYFAQPIRLQFSQAVQVQPLTPEQIDRYLDGACTEPLLRQALQDDQDLLDMCSNPFVLSLLVELANEGEVSAAIALTGSIEERRKQLFEAFLHRKQDPQTASPYSQQQILTSLSWLARQIHTHRQSAFYPERMQPDWLPDERAQQQYRLLVYRLLLGLTVLLFSGLLACFRGDLIPRAPGLFFWLGGGGGDSVLGWMAPGIGGGMLGATSLSLLYALVVLLVQLLGNRERIPIITPRALRHALLVGLRWALLIGGAASIISGILFSQEAGLTCLGGSLSGVACGSSIGLFGGIIAGFQIALPALLRYDTRVFAKEEKKHITRFSWKDKATNALLFGGCGFVSFVSIYGLQAGNIDQLALCYGLVAGVFSGLIYHQGFEFGAVPELGITIQLAETVVWSWHEVRSHLFETFKQGAALAGMLLVCVVLLITCLSSLFYGVNYGIRYGLVYGAIVAVISGVTGWLMGVLTSGWSNEMLGERAFARTNEGIRRAWRNALFAACLFGPIGGLTSGGTSALAFALAGVPGWLILGAGLAFVLTIACSYQIFMLFGGIALIEHYVLRWCLWRKGLLPWKSIAFCNHAVERVFLNRWGRGYKFIHTLLEEHFANRESH
jgi:transcriptional regulator with XRE-family HTH domain